MHQPTLADRRFLDRARITVVETFGSSSDPDAVCRYQRSVEETREIDVTEGFWEYFSSVLIGITEQLRDDTAQNPQLAKVERMSPGITALFTQACLPAACKADFNHTWDSKHWLRQKLVSDNHLPTLDELPHLRAVLFGESEDAHKRCSRESYSAARSLQLSCFNLMAAQQVDAQIKALAGSRMD